MLAEKNESIKKSIVTLKELTADEQAKMQMEARERYRRDMIAAEIFGREQSEKEIEELKNNLQQSKEEISKLKEESVKFKEESVKLKEESAKLQKESTKYKEESLKKDEQIRFLEAQLEKANKK